MSKSEKITAEWADGLALLHREYGGKHGQSYLCGRDSDGVWVARVPGRIRTVEEAIQYVSPPAVSRAAEEGRRVLRLGEVYVVESTTRRDSGANRLPADYHWDEHARTLTHDGDLPPLNVPFPAVFLRMRTLAISRGHCTAE